jgi:hypothetical protein
VVLGVDVLLHGDDGGAAAAGLGGVEAQGGAVAAPPPKKRRAAAAAPTLSEFARAQVPATLAAQQRLLWVPPRRLVQRRSPTGSLTVLM